MQIFRKDIGTKIQEAYAGDLFAAELKKGQQGTNTLMFRGKIYLPLEYVKEVIKEHYNDPLQGHLGITKTLEIIGKIYARPKLRESVIGYIKKYMQY